MKLFNNISTKLLLASALALVLLIGLLLPAVIPDAHAQAASLITPTKYEAFDNVPSIVEGSATSNVVSTAVRVRPGKGVTVWPLFAGTNAGTANFIVGLALTRDGTNWSTVPVTRTNAMNGTTAVLGALNFPKEVFEGSSHFRLQTLQNAHTASLFVTNVHWSVSNNL